MAERLGVHDDVLREEVDEGLAAARARQVHASQGDGEGVDHDELRARVVQVPPGVVAREKPWHGEPPTTRTLVTFGYLSSNENKKAPPRASTASEYRKRVPRASTARRRAAP